METKREVGIEFCGEENGMEGAENSDVQEETCCRVYRNHCRVVLNA